MKNNFSLDISRLENLKSNKKTDAIPSLRKSTYGLTIKNDYNFIHYSDDLQKLVEKASIILHPNFIDSEVDFLEFLEKYELVFAEGMPLVWQHKHRLNFVNQLYKQYMFEELQKIISNSVLYNEYYKSPVYPQVQSWHRGRIHLDSDLWISMNIEHFIETKKLNTEVGISKHTYICGISIEYFDAYIAGKSEDLSKKVTDYFMENFDPKDIAFGDTKFGPRSCQTIIGFSNEDQMNYMHLSAPFKFTLLGAIDFAPLVDKIKTAQNVIENKFLKS